MKSTLTRKQKEIFDFYENFITENKKIPSYTEAGELLGIDRTVVFNHVKNLEKKGYLLADKWNIQILDTEQTKIPLLWAVACGSPIAVHEEVSEYIDVPESYIILGYNYYALKAKGDSMKDAWINDGDTLIIRQQTDIDNWDIAVVVLWEYEDEERATLKRVYKTPSAMYLKAENDSFPTQVVTWPSEVRWKLISVIRNY